MTTIVFDGDYENDVARRPISLHAAFPAIVALWFAALVGLGGLVLPGVLLDRVIAMAGLASLVPAASPPLGFTARGIIAIAGALLGAGLGLSIARRLARAHQPQVPSCGAGPATGLPRPISVREELGVDSLVNGEGLPLDNRRALPIGENDRPSDVLYRVPLSIDDYRTNASADDDPVELVRDDDTGDEDCEMTNYDEFPAAAQPHQRHASEPEVRPGAIRSEGSEFRADWETAPLEGLGLVQLVQRLGATIERHRDLAARGSTAAAVTFTAAAADFDPAPAREAAEATAAYFAPGRTTVSVAEDPETNDDVSDDGYSSLLVIGNPFAAPKNEFVGIDGREPGNVLAEPAVAFPGAASAPKAPADADAALRAALATLQRMSGAA